MTDPEYTPFPGAAGDAETESAYARKVCSSDSKPPRWYVSARAGVEPRVHVIEGAVVVEHNGRIVKYASGPDGALTRVRASRKPKG